MTVHVHHIHTHTHTHVVQELTQLQDKHATRPDVFDDVEEEQEIEILTQEITQVHVYNNIYSTTLKSKPVNYDRNWSVCFQQILSYYQLYTYVR